GHGLVAELRNQLSVGVVLVDHGAVDAVHLVVLVAVGDVGEHRAPHDHGKAELVIGVNGGDRGRRAIMRRAGDDVLVGRHLGRDLDGDVRFALIVEHDHLVFVFGFRVGIAQPDGEVSRVTAAEAVDRNAARQRADKSDFDFVLRFGGRGGKAQRNCRDARRNAAWNFGHTASLVFVFVPKWFFWRSGIVARGHKHGKRLYAATDGVRRYNSRGVEKKKGGRRAALWFSFV